MEFSLEKLDPEVQSKKAYKDVQQAVLDKAGELLNRSFEDIASAKGLKHLNNDPEVKVKIARMAREAINGADKQTERGFYAEDPKGEKVFVKLTDLDKIFAESKEAQALLSAQGASKVSQLIPNKQQVNLMASAVGEAVYEQLSTANKATTISIAGATFTKNTASGLFSTNSTPISAEQQIQITFAENIRDSAIKNLQKLAAGEDKALKLMLSEKRITEIGKEVYNGAMGIKDPSPAVQIKQPTSPAPQPPKQDQIDQTASKPTTTSAKGDAQIQQQRNLKRDKKPISQPHPTGKPPRNDYSKGEKAGVVSGDKRKAASSQHTDATPKSDAPAAASSQHTDATPKPDAPAAVSSKPPKFDDELPEVDTSKLVTTTVNPETIETVRKVAKDKIYKTVLEQTEAKIAEGIEEEKNKLRKGGWLENGIKGFFVKLLDLLGPIGEWLGNLFGLGPNKDDVKQASQQVASTVSETLTQKGFEHNGKPIQELSPTELQEAIQKQVLGDLRKNRDKNKYAGFNDENLEQIAKGAGEAMAEKKNFDKIKEIPPDIYGDGKGQGKGDKGFSDLTPKGDLKLQVKDMEQHPGHLYPNGGCQSPSAIAARR